MARSARVVAFSTTPEMAEEIDRLATEEGRTRSELLREAFRAYGARDATPAHVSEARAAYAPAAAPSLPGLACVLSRRSEIAALAAEAGVARLWLFGSAVRDDFDPARSDFDFLVEFRTDTPRKAWMGELFELQDALAGILGGRVDLGESGGLTNPHTRAAVDAEKVLVFEQP